MAVKFLFSDEMKVTEINNSFNEMLANQIDLAHGSGFDYHGGRGPTPNTFHVCIQLTVVQTCIPYLSSKYMSILSTALSPV